MLHTKRQGGERSKRGGWTTVRPNIKGKGAASYAEKKHTPERGESKWWEGKSITECEEKIAENTTLQCKVQQRMSKEAESLLKNNEIDAKWDNLAKASHLANCPRLTETCEARRLTHGIDVYESLNSKPAGAVVSKPLSDTPFNYSVSYGCVENTQDAAKIYHVEYDQQYAELNLVDGGIVSIKPSKVPSQGLNLMLERRYVSLISLFMTRAKECIDKAYVSHGDIHTIPPVLGVLESLSKLDNADLVSEEPDISHSNTSDYIIYTCSSTYKKVIQPDRMVKIRRRMVIASLRYSNPPVNIPLAEEIFIETMSKNVGVVNEDEDAPFTTDEKSVVLNFSLISDAFPQSESHASTRRCNVSTVSFFGKNAFSVSIDTFTPSNKKHFTTGHETAMNLTGWLIRKLDAAAVAANHGALTGDELFGSLLDSSGKGFVAEQNAGMFIKKYKNKYFYTKTWLASQTLAVIAITQAADTSKSIVVVWSGGRVVGRSVEESVQAPLTSSPAAFRSKYSALPLDLELELQSL